MLSSSGTGFPGQESTGPPAAPAPDFTTRAPWLQPQRGTLEACSTRGGVAGGDEEGRLSPMGGKASLPIPSHIPASIHVFG